MKTESQDNQRQIKKINLEILEECAVENFEVILDDLEIFDYIKFDDRYQGRCHIHDGDNNTAWCFYLGKNVWNCYTHDCHRDFGNSIFDFIRGMKDCGFAEAINYLCTLLGFDIDEEYKEKEEEFYLKKIKQRSEKRIVKKTTYKKDCLDKLEDCSSYMRKRGFDKDIIENFQCGYATSGKLSRRVVFPICDDIGEIVGFIGRTVFSQCDNCGFYHGKTEDGECPQFSTRAKWLCSKSLDKNLILYNLDRAKESIEEKGSVIITEGIIDLMRLWSVGIRNVVSPLGVSLSSQQLILLLSLGTIRKVYLCTDDDKAGLRFKDNHAKYEDVNENKSFVSLSRYLNVEKIECEGKKDIGEMTKEETFAFCEKNGLL